jgi:hypothetical protein
MSVPFKVDLSQDVVAITGGGGILCGCMASWTCAWKTPKK